MTALLLGFTFHEFSHALAATRLGDPTPRYRGRLTLNPLAHLDPAGTVLLFLVGFGWGKPVPVNPNLMRGDPKTNMALTAAAGPISNLVVAGLAGLAIKLDFVPWRSPFNVPNLASLERRRLPRPLPQLNRHLRRHPRRIQPHPPLPPGRLLRGRGHSAPRPLAFLRGAARLGAGPALPPYRPALRLTGGRFGLLFQIMAPAVNGLTRLLTGIDINVYG